MAITFSVNDDLIIPSVAGETYQGLGGDDTYILTNALQAGTAITIDDTQGINRIQLVDGLIIASTTVYPNAIQLVLSNGAIVNILSAGRFIFEPGGNMTAGVTGGDRSFSQFVEIDLSGTVPADGESPTTSGTVTIHPSDAPPDDPVSSVLSADTGTVALPVNLNANGDSFRFTDDADLLNNVIIADFTNNDVIQVTNAVNGDYSFSNDGTDVNIVYNNNGIINSIQLTGVVQTNDIVSDEATFETAIGFDAFMIV